MENKLKKIIGTMSDSITVVFIASLAALFPAALAVDEFGGPTGADILENVIAHGFILLTTAMAAVLILELVRWVIWKR